MMHESQRVVVVTGSAGGIGRAVVERFRAAGDRVIGLDRDGDCDHRIDVIDTDALHALAAEIGRKHGRIDVWVNNAGVLQRAPALELTAAQWSRTLSVNLDATFFGAQAAARVMSGSGGGAIVNMASYAALRPRTGSLDYAVSKAAVSHLTACLALEWAGLGIRVNALAPGYVETPMIDWMHDEDAREGLLSRVPVKSFAEPHEIAAAIAYLSSAEARYITGITMPIDGGISLT